MTEVTRACLKTVRIESTRSRDSGTHASHLKCKRAATHTSTYLLEYTQLSVHITVPCAILYLAVTLYFLRQHLHKQIYCVCAIYCFVIRDRLARSFPDKITVFLVKPVVGFSFTVYYTYNCEKKYYFTVLINYIIMNNFVLLEYSYRELN